MSIDAKSKHCPGYSPHLWDWTFVFSLRLIKDVITGNNISRGEDPKRTFKHGKGGKDSVTGLSQLNPAGILGAKGTKRPILWCPGWFM